FAKLPMFLSAEYVQQHLHPSFSSFPKCVLITDSLSVYVPRPKNLTAQSITYNDYYGGNVMKELIDIAPTTDFPIVFLSELFSGAISDKELAVRCGLTKLNYPLGIEIMADKGFHLQDVEQEKQWKFVIPSFLDESGQCSSTDIGNKMKISSVRIRVDHAIDSLSIPCCIERGTEDFCESLNSK
ncbi:unnamed protein product, partial [Didymodactylos carnosus]